MTPITYPARPINGGAFNPAVPKVGPWFVEPKDNGWRALVHAPTGTMFNRHGEQLSIATEFAAALALLRENAGVAEWFDCEALDRRHGLCRGTLIILDLIIPGTYAARLGVRLAGMPNCPVHELTEDVTNGIRQIPSYQGRDGAEVYDDLKRANTILGCEFYEGIVMKQGGSPYPIQRLSPERTTHTWVKHRWAW